MATQPDLPRVVTQLMEALEGLDAAYCRSRALLTREERMEDRQRMIAARAAIAAAKKDIEG